MKPTQQEIIDVARAVDIVPGIGDVVNGKYRPHKNALGKSVPVEWLQGFAKLLLERFGAGGGEPICHLMECKDIYGEPCFIQIDDPEGVEGVFPVYTHPSPTDLRAEYLRGLEEAAKVCDEVSLQANSAWNMAYRLQDQGREVGADECADAIRALKGKQ